MAVTKPGRASKDKNVKSKKKNKLKKLAGTVLKYSTPYGVAISIAKKRKQQLRDRTKNKKPQTKKAKGLPALTPPNPMVPERRKVKRTQGPGGGSGKSKIIKNKRNY